MKKLVFALCCIPFLIIVSSCKPKTTDISKSVLESQIRTILEVPTTEYVYREILYLGKEARFLGIKHLDTRLLFSVDIIIQAGFDLTKGITIENTIHGLKIILPSPEILLADIDEDSIHQFFVKEWGGKISRLEYYDELDKRKKSIIKDAIHRGILIKAEENGTKTILDLLKPLVKSDLVISFTSTDGGNQ